MSQTGDGSLFGGGAVEALAFVERTKPDIALIDDVGADGPLLPAIRRMIEVSPHTRPVVLSDDCPGGDLRHAIEAGIWGYLNREARQRTLLWALMAVAARGAGRSILTRRGWRACYVSSAA